MFKKRGKEKIAVSVLLSLCAQVTMAGNQDNLPIASSLLSSPFVVTLSAGPSWAKAGTTQTLHLQPQIDNTYIANRDMNSLASSSIFIGWQHPLHPKMLGQFGFTVGASGSAKLSGDIWENMDPNFDDYYYSYKVNNTYIGIKGNLLLMNHIWTAQPYINGSVGIAFNKSHSYNSTPKIPQNAPVPPFIEHNNSSFSFVLGAGLQKQLNEHWSVGMGYEFANWGNSQLGPMTELSINRGLSLSSLYTNSLMFNLSYLA